MSAWLHNLPIVWMAAVVFASCYFVAAIVFGIVSVLARGKAGIGFRGVSPGMLSPLGVIFGLLVAFIAAQVWGDADRARLAVDREASSLRTIVLLASAFSGEEDAQLREFVARHIELAVNHEWASMADQSATVRLTSPALAEGLRFAIALQPKNPGQIAAQRELVSAFESALDARRQRIIFSRSRVNWVKWVCLLAQALFMIIAIAVVHSDNRGASAIAMAIFTTGFAVSILLIASHDRPFTGQIAIKPDLLLQVRPDDTSALIPGQK